ncbi:MAG: hypothetical protein ACLRSW_07550 [Christensenellaceae bacterium]
MTHDSIGVGEDGPHEPVDADLPAFDPGMSLPSRGRQKQRRGFRAQRHGHNAGAPQNLPQYEASGLAALKRLRSEDCEGTPDVLLIGSGSRWSCA